MNNKNFAFGKVNFILLAISVVIIVAGFILMSGSGSTEEAFNPDIFSARRIKVAPIVCFVGFALVCVAIMYNPKKGAEVVESEPATTEE